MQTSRTPGDYTKRRHGPLPHWNALLIESRAVAVSPSLPLLQMAVRGIAACFLILALTLPVHAQTQTGYATVTATGSSNVPVTSALFTFHNADGVLVSQAAVAAVEPVRSGRIFVDESLARTAFAAVNPAVRSSTLTLTLRDAGGAQTAVRSISLDAGHHLSRFVGELFPGLPAGFRGSLTIDADPPVASIALRESLNSLQEPLYATLPVIDLAAGAASSALVFPHIAAGGGFLTQVFLMNTGSTSIRGEIRLFASNGTPMTARNGDLAVTRVTYDIEPHGTFRADFDADATQSGWVTVVPADGSRAAEGTTVFQYRNRGRLQTEAAVAATSTTTYARLFVDGIGTRTGLALANPGDRDAAVRLTLLNREGEPLADIERTVPASGHLAAFADELFAGVADFSGLIEVRSPLPVAAITLKLTQNARGDLVLTTLPVADMNRPPVERVAIVPQIANGGGFSTRLITLNGSTLLPAAGTIRFSNPTAGPLILSFGSATASLLDYNLPAGTGRQFYPGNAARPVSIAVLDSRNRETTEVVVNENSLVRIRLRVVDSAGSIRDDFEPVILSSTPAIAAIDSSGRLAGRSAGFSSLTITAGGAVTTSTATVVRVEPGTAGFATGIAQDLSRRLYLTSTDDHAVLLAEDLSRTPAVYAGTPRSPGLRNDARLQSQFRAPGYLSFNQADASLYVSDSANHVIRRVTPGAAGSVTTLAGSGTPGTRDGPLAAASFNEPQGIALDSRGQLWVADSGSHTIRRIELQSGLVRTIAGQAGSPGTSDGIGSAARFSSPTGVAVESESLAAQLERERRGLGPAPVRVIVADRGSGRLRRVHEDGTVETLGAAASPALVRTAGAKPAADAVVWTPFAFDAPTGVTTDHAGNIYVSEPGSGSVRVVLRNGTVVPALQTQSLREPRGLVAAVTGRVIVADSARSIQELRYGEPRITSTAPGSVSTAGGATVTVRGLNFAPDTIAIVAGVVIENVRVQDTQTMTFVSPALPSGRHTLTLQNRGGIAQAPLIVDAPRLSGIGPGRITTVAGGSVFSGEGHLATAIAVLAEHVAVDSAGNLIVSDTGNHRIRRIDNRTGVATTIAGSGRPFQTGDGGPAVAAGLDSPRSIVLDNSGNLYVADGRVRRIDAATGIITTVAGRDYGYCGEGGPATAACFTLITDLALDDSGNLYITDRFNHRLHRVDARTGIFSTIAGNGQETFGGDGGPATMAALNNPYGVVIDQARNSIYIGDTGNDRIRRIDLNTGIITTLAGGGPRGLPANGDGGPASLAHLETPVDVVLDGRGGLIIANRGNSSLRRVDLATGIMTTVAGGQHGYGGDNGPATAARFREILGLAIDAAGNILIADSGNNRIRRVDSTTGNVTTIAGTGAGAEIYDRSAATAATLRHPSGVVRDRSGHLLITDTGNDRIRRVDAQTGIISTLAGGGTPASGNGDGGPASAAGLYAPEGRVALDAAGNIYIAETYSYRVRRVDAQTGVITTVAGTGEPSSNGDGLPATAAAMLPSYVAVDSRGNLFVVDQRVRRIRRVDASTGIITTFAGGGNPANGIGDLGPATAAVFGEHLTLAVDSRDNLIVTDVEHGRVRRIDATTRIISTIAGGGTAPHEENQRATFVKMLPVDAFVDGAGTLFVIDYEYPGGIRRVPASTGLVSSIVGHASENTDPGDGGPASKAFLYYPRSIFVDSSGNLYIADTDNHRIRAVQGPLP